jgi:hypothetical protein
MDYVMTETRQRGMAWLTRTSSPDADSPLGGRAHPEMKLMGPAVLIRWRSKKDPVSSVGTDVEHGCHAVRRGFVDRNVAS